MEKKDLTSVLKDAAPGEWVALPMDRTRIVGRGKTAEEAKRAATETGEQAVVLLHVPFPNIRIAASPQRLPLGEIPKWFLAIAAVVYASGFLVVFTFQGMWGLGDAGVEFLRIKYLHAGFLCNLPLLIVGVPIYGTLRIRQLGSQLWKGAQEFPVSWPTALAFVNYLVFLYGAYMFVSKERFERDFGAFRMLYIFLFIIAMVLIQVTAQIADADVGPPDTENTLHRITGWILRRKDTLRKIIERSQYILLGFSVAANIYALYIAGLALFLEGFGGRGRTSHSGMWIFLLFMFAIGLMLVRLDARSSKLQETEKQHHHSHLALRLHLWSTGLSTALAFYCLYVLAFAYTVYPYIPAERGGGSYVNSPSVSISILKTAQQAIPSGLSGDCSKGVCLLPPLVIVEETPSYLYVANPRGDAAIRWRRGYIPEIYALRQDSVANIAYIPVR